MVEAEQHFQPQNYFLRDKCLYMCVCYVCLQKALYKTMSLFLASCTHLTLGNSPQECETAVEHFVFGPKGILGCICFVPCFMISRISCNIVLEVAQLSPVIRSKYICEQLWHELRICNPGIFINRLKSRSQVLSSL